MRYPAFDVSEIGPTFTSTQLALPGKNVGIFDTGYGGLSVARAAILAIRGSSFHVLIDNLGRPAGSKTTEELKRLKTSALSRLAHCRLVLCACNTFCTVAHDGSPGSRIVSILEAGCRGMLVPMKASRRKLNIVVLGTQYTIESGAYPTHLARLAEEAGLPVPIVHGIACDHLATLIDAGIPQDHRIARAVLRDLLAWPSPVDYCILGCSHYSAYSMEIERLLTPGAALLDPNILAVREVEGLLAGEAAHAFPPAVGKVYLELTDESRSERARLRQAWLDGGGRLEDLCWL